VFRTILEHLSRRITFKRRLPARVGGAQVCVSPDAALAFWRRNLEHTWGDLFDFACNYVRRGHNVWDIGANVGMFAFAAACQAGVAGSVLAVEPDDACCALLRRSCAMQPQGHAPVSILNAAISDGVGIAAFTIAARGRSANHLTAFNGSTATGAVRSTVTVETVDLDNLLGVRGPPQVLKIDVEGAETAVLRGGTRVLSHHPTILVEVSNCNAEECTRLLTGQHYRLFDFATGQRIERCAFNTLAL
jgi:FkbM family methyltransferase